MVLQRAGGPQGRLETFQKVTDERDIYRSANALINQHGYNDAKLHATMRADAMLEQGDMEGRRTWHLVLAAIEVLGDTTPNGVIH